MIIDCHVHVSAITPANGLMSDRLVNSVPFRFMRWRMGIEGNDADTERAIARKLIDTIDGAEQLDAAVVLAFDAVHEDDGSINLGRTHLYVTNDYVIELARQYPKVLIGASIHPYRKDAVKELERCVAAGAVLLKWLPVVQDFNPADPRCFPFYEALAHHKLPLLSHTGGEQSLPAPAMQYAPPRLLEPAVRRGVTVIAAHCGTRSSPAEDSYVGEFCRMAHEHEHFYGDTAALNLPFRCYAWDTVLHDRVVREKLVHGSDWPIIALPPVGDLGIRRSLQVMRETNWMRRDILIKQELGLGDDYWHRAGQVLGHRLGIRTISER